MKLSVQFGTPHFGVKFGTPSLGISTGNLIIRDAVQLPPYTGDYTVAPTTEEQVLATKNLRMTDDVTIEAIPQGSARATSFSAYIIPTMSVDDNGKVKATYDTTDRINVPINSGYFDTFPTLNYDITVSGSQQLSTLSGRTITPSEQQQTISTKSKYLTGNIVIEPIPSNYGLVEWNGSVLTVS